MTKNEMRMYAKKNGMTMKEVREMSRRNASNDNHKLPKQKEPCFVFNLIPQSGGKDGQMSVAFLCSLQEVVNELYGGEDCNPLKFKLNLESVKTELLESKVMDFDVCWTDESRSVYRFFCDNPVPTEWMPLTIDVPEKCLHDTQKLTHPKMVA
jgi:hypothetical protein